MAGDTNTDIPDTGAVFTFGRSRFANNAASHFFIRNDPVVEMSCGDDHTAVVCQNGRVFAFGSNRWGQLGLGHQNTATMPSCVKSLKPEKATHVACGVSHTIVSTFSGKVFAFGANMDCQLGLGDNDERLLPTEVSGIDAGENGIRMLAAGCQHSAVLTVDGKVFVWGSNSDGQLGLGESITEANSPRCLDLPHTIAYISCGYYHTALVTEEGKLFMCGEGEYGKLGLSRENKNVFVPSPVNITVPVRYAACGGNHTIAVTMDGEVYGFGSNLSGQLGLGRQVLSSSIPECVETLLGKYVFAAACGESHSAFLTVDGHMYTCGDGRHGKLCSEIENAEEGSVNSTPQFVSRFSQYRIKQVACGGCHTMVQAVVELDAPKGEPESSINGDVAPRPQKLEINGNGKLQATEEGLGRTLPPLQNVPPINGHHEILPKTEMHEKVSEDPKTEPEKEADAATASAEGPVVQDEQTSESLPNGLGSHEKQNPDSAIPSENISSDVLSKDEPGGLKHATEINGSQETTKHSQNGTTASEEEINDDVFSKYNLRYASDLTGNIVNGSGENHEDSNNPMMPTNEEGDEDKTNDDRRCSVDVTPTLTVTGTDGVDLDSEEAGGDRTANKQSILASMEKGESKVAKFLNAFRRKKLSEENVSVNAAWADVDRRVSSENNIRNGKRSSQSQLRSGQVHRSKACIIL